MQKQHVVIRFCGDSGDGMQLTGTMFASLSAILGNEMELLSFCTNQFPYRDEPYLFNLLGSVGDGFPVPPLRFLFLQKERNGGNL